MAYFHCQQARLNLFLHYSISTLFRLAEYAWGVICGHVVICGVINPYQRWSMLHITLMKWWDTIFIPASSFVDHYTTDEDHDSSSWYKYPGILRWSCGGLGNGPPLSDVDHDLYNTHETVGYHIHTCIIILGPLYHWWGPWFKLLVPISRVTAEYSRSVVCAHVGVCGVIHPYQGWSMLHIKLMKW